MILKLSRRCATLLTHFFSNHRCLSLDDLFLLQMHEVPPGVSHSDEPEEHTNAENQSHDSEEINNAVDSTGEYLASQKEIKRRTKDRNQEPAEATFSLEAIDTVP